MVRTPIFRRVKNNTFLTLFFATFFVLTGCLSEGENVTTSGSTTPPATNPTTEAPLIVELNFAGVASVQNLNGNDIKISWVRSTNSKVIGYRIYEIKEDGTLGTVKQVDSSKSAFLHTGLVLGSMHSYLVKAIDANGNYDGNMVIKSTFTYSGISAVNLSSMNSATVYFSPPTGAVAAHIYYKAVRSSSWTLAGSADSSATSFEVTGLRTGTTYDFKVHAVDVSDDEDSNPLTARLQTPSLSFNPNTPLARKYKGFMLAQAYGASSGAPTSITGRQSTLVWESFNSTANTTVQYALVRVAKGGELDMTATQACTPTTTTSCRVCLVSGTTENKSCTDTQLGAPPAVYEYAVSMASATDWPEELPSDSNNQMYRTIVQVPPDNMVLVHRDSVNYELCKLMGKTDIDPLNKQRCSISGASMVGARPYNTNPNNSPLNLPTGYFDFGYNMFVDRYTAACNWTPRSGTYTGQTVENEGMCGANNTDGDCFGTGAPTSTIGKIGNVYYDTTAARCWIKTSDTVWLDSNSSLSAAQRLAMTTIKPKDQGGFRPPLAVINQANSNASCNAFVDPNYGAKRLLRKREWSAAAAWPTLQGVPNAMDDTTIASMESAGAANAHTSAGGYQCNSANHKGLTAGAFKTTNIAGDAGDAVKSFNIGSIETSNCVSRFGAQDMVGNVWEWNSDQMYCNATASAISTPYNLNAYNCLGLQSSVDAGNGFSSGFDMNGFMFDGIQGPVNSAATSWAYENGSYSAARFNPILSLPMVGNDNGNAVLVSANTAKFHGDAFYISYAGTNGSRGLSSGGNWNVGASSGRWASSWVLAPTLTYSSIGFRCGLPAE